MKNQAARRTTGIYGIHQSGTGRIIDINNLYAGSHIRNVSIVALYRHIVGGTAGVIAACKRRSSRVADVDNQQSARIICHISIVTDDFNASG